MISKFSLSLICAGLISATTLAHASTIGSYETFTLTNPGGLSAAGPFGTITLTQIANNEISVSEALASGVNFSGTGAGDDLEFNVDVPNTISSLTSGFEVGPAPDTAPPFTGGNASQAGSFLESVTCGYNGGACHGGSGPSSLFFDVTATSGSLSLSDFTDVGTSNTVITYNNQNIFFTSDVFVSGNTGNVGAGVGTVHQVVTPEPSSLVLIGTGLVGFAGAVRRRFAKA